MTIAFEPVSMVTGDRMMSVLYDNKRIREMARLMVVSQAEAYVDLMSDMPAEYKAFEEVESCMERVQESTQEYITDLLVEFEEELRKAVNDVKVTVRNATFSKEGLKDCEVYVC